MFFGGKTHKGRGTTYCDNIKVRSQIKNTLLFCNIKHATRLPKASCLTLEIKELRCYEVKIEESEKAGSYGELKSSSCHGS